MDPNMILAVASMAKDLFKDGKASAPKTGQMFGEMSSNPTDPMSMIGGMASNALGAYDMYKNPNKAIGGLIGDQKMGNNLYDLYMGRSKKEG